MSDLTAMLKSHVAPVQQVSNHEKKTDAAKLDSKLHTLANMKLGIQRDIEAGRENKRPVDVMNAYIKSR